MRSTDEATANAIARALTGDRSACAELYRMHVAALMRQCSAFSSLDAADVDDIVQETFVRAFKHLARLKSPTTFRPWLFAIARSLVLTLVHTRAHRERCLGELAVEEGEVGLIPDSVERDARIDVVRRLIAELPEGRERETATLFYVEGSMARDIAALHQVGKSAVTMRLERFRGRIRERLVQRVDDLDVGSS